MGKPSLVLLLVSVPLMFGQSRNPASEGDRREFFGSNHTD